jgi:TonB family protein
LHVGNAGTISNTAEIIVELAEAHGVTVVAVTTDSELRATLTDLLPRNSIVFSDSAEQMLACPAPNHCAVLIVEQTQSRPAFEQLKAYLNASSPALVSIMVGTQDDGSSLVGLLAAGCIDRFMTKPLKLGPTRSALRSALQQHHSLRPRAEAESAKPDALASKSGSAAPNVQVVTSHTMPELVMRSAKRKIAAVPQLRVEHVWPHLAESRSPNLESDPEDVSVPIVVAPRESTMRAAEAPRRLPAPSWTLAFAAMIAVAGFVAWGMSLRAPEVEVNKAMVSKIVVGHLAAAQRAFELEAYVDPPELSATHFYNTILELDPTNAQATQGLAAVADRLIADTKQLINEGDLLRAQSALDSVRRVEPSHPELAAVTASLINARATERLAIQTAHATTKPNLESIGAAPQATVAATRVVSKSSANVERSVDNNLPDQRLLPSEPRASDTVDAASGTKSPEATHLASVADLSLIALSGAPQSRDAQLKRVGEGKSVESTQAESAMVSSAKVSVATTVSPERLISPVEGSGPSPSATGITDRPKLIKYVPPVYPAKTGAGAVEGGVEVSFLVTSDGNVTNAHAEQGKLGYQFHRAALAAVTQWKFSPASNGATSNQPMHVRLEFRVAK